MGNGRERMNMTSAPLERLLGASQPQRRREKKGFPAALRAAERWGWSNGPLFPSSCSPSAQPALPARRLQRPPHLSPRLVSVPRLLSPSLTPTPRHPSQELPAAKLREFIARPPLDGDKQPLWCLCHIQRKTSLLSFRGAVLGVHCGTWTLLVFGAWALECAGSVAAVHGLSCGVWNLTSTRD